MADTEKMLRISDDLAFPPDIVTETLLIIAKRGSGKTHCASVLVEEMVTAGLPVAVIDPIGVWWGLRSSADGQGPGLPVTILGGEHADLPLPAEAGTLAADLIIDERLPVVLDLSLMPKTQQRRFVTGFLERVYHRNRDPLHLVIDEADLYAPLRGAKESAQLLGAYEDIVRRGRARGLGCTSITQRPAVLHTDIRSQAEVLIALRLIGTHDVAAIDEWVRLHATDEEARQVKASLPSLPVGTAWVWSPGWLELLAKVKIRQRRTFDSSATPKVGQQLITPREFAPVDIEALQARLAAVTEKAEQDDPKVLRRRIAELERQARDGVIVNPGELGRLEAENRDLRAQLAEALARPPERVEVPVFAKADLAALQEASERIAAAAARAAAVTGSASAGPAPAVPAPSPMRSPAPVVRRLPPVPASAPDPGGPKLRAGARNMLTVLARQHPVKINRRQLATLAKLKVTGGTFGTYFGDLRRGGYITEQDGFVVLTEAGFAYTGASPDLPVTADELRETWRGSLRAGARKMLDILLDRYPQPVTRAELAALTDLEQTGGTFGTYLGDLRRNGLADEDEDGLRAAEVFFLGGGDA